MPFKYVSQYRGIKTHCHLDKLSPLPPTSLLTTLLEFKISAYQPWNLLHPNSLLEPGGIRTDTDTGAGRLENILLVLLSPKRVLIEW